MPLLLPIGWANQGERESRSGGSESMHGLKACSARSLIIVFSRLLCPFSWWI